MRVYPPSYYTPEESSRALEGFAQRVESMDVADETIVSYLRALFGRYREVLETYFSGIARAIPFYTGYPYDTVVLRSGPNAVMFFHRANGSGEVDLLRQEELDPPVQTANIYELADRFGADYTDFSFVVRAFDAAEADTIGTQRALRDALRVVWNTINPDSFGHICRELLYAEEVRLSESPPMPSPSRRPVPDAVGTVLLPEPGGFRRFERWAFEFKHTSTIEDLGLTGINGRRPLECAVLCLITSGDLTSVGHGVADDIPGLRVWDRDVLDRLVNKHLDRVGHHFSEYTRGVTRLEDELARRASTTPARLEEFKGRLRACRTGGRDSQRFASEYERIGVEMWEYLFSPTLRNLGVQHRTGSRTQRRDVLFENMADARFWRRAADRARSEFVLVDFKNYAGKIGSDDVYKVRSYHNDAIGHLSFILCRHGGNSNVPSAQISAYQNNDHDIVLVVSDQQMLEMVERKERGEQPEDVLDDLLTQFLTRV